jgi:hypothetical protein
MVTANSVIDSMITLLNEKGWIQKRSITKDGFCIYGAYNEVCRPLKSEKDWEAANDAFLKIYSTATTKLNEQTNASGVIVWNDKKGRTKEEVIAMLERARDGG